MASAGAKDAAAARGALPVLDVAALLAKRTLREEWVDVPEWECRVKVRELSMGAYQSVNEKATDPRGNLDESKLQTFLCLAGIVEPELADDAYEWMRGQSMRAVNRVLEKVMALSGIGIGALEDIEATFPEAPGDNVEVPPSA